MRRRHVCIVGAAGTGKSVLLERMILDDIRRGHGVLVLDPHGCMTTRLLHLLPRHVIHKTIYFKPGDPDWVPLWNPLQSCSQVDRSRCADRLVRALMSGKSFFGDRVEVEHVLRHAIFGAIHLPGGNLLDTATLLCRKSADSHRLRSRLLDVIDNKFALQFWKYEFLSYTDAQLSAPRSLCSRLLTVDGIGEMLSQPVSRFDLREVMDSGKILLVDLSAIDADTAGILGRFMLSSLHMTAIGRRHTAEKANHPFHVYCDEAHRFVTDAMEDLINETRKHDVSLVLAHQYMSQFEKSEADALSSVGSRIIFRVDQSDANYLCKDFQGKVEPKELVVLRTGNAVARIGDHVVLLKTLPPAIMPQHHFYDEIIARCHQLYCLPSERLLRRLR